MARFCMVAAIVCFGLNGAWAGEAPADRETAARRAIAERRAAPAGARRDDRAEKAIADFVAVEEIARLPQPQREEQVPRFYRELAPRYMGPAVEIILSSFPADLFHRAGFANPGDASSSYEAQMDAAADALTPRAMAEAILELHGPNIVAMATRRRCIQTLARHKATVKKLIEEDLDSDELSAVRRACSTVNALKLKDFNDRLLRIYLAEGKFADEAQSAIVWLNDPDMTGALVADIEKNPAALKRHYGLLNGMLWGRAAEPPLVKLLDSPDADTRCWAASALRDCLDPTLAPHIKTMLADKDARLRLAAAHMAGRLPVTAFGQVRGELLKVLASEELELRIEAASAFAEHKDAAAGNTLLELWQRPLPENMKTNIMQAVDKMTDSTFGYDMHEWARPTPDNVRAIEGFRQWIREHEGK